MFRSAALDGESRRGRIGREQGRRRLVGLAADLQVETDWMVLNKDQIMEGKKDNYYTLPVTQSRDIIKGGLFFFFSLIQGRWTPELTFGSATACGENEAMAILP